MVAVYENLEKDGNYTPKEHFPNPQTRVDLLDNNKLIAGKVGPDGWRSG